ncbi:ABC transporter ATP-binding protein [Pseudolysinimonas sp.]|jgi:oligopeptide transport system ATP-binding protein|uniref:ABC transporter ATP-binding protein n=1 Tax=Pseudolysinimonas sp. TaxID=2680009 RepID=UPI003783C671
MAILDVRGLRTEFTGSRGPVVAVDDVSFTVEAGEFVALVGESGCGKSATAQSIMGLIPPQAGRVTAGEVLFEGTDLLTMPARELRRIRGKRMAMVFQDPMTSLNPVLTISRQITEILETHLGLDRRAARRRAIELLEMVRIPAAESRLAAYPHELSGGMRQRVMIAMGLACKPQLLLADEITTALDVTIQAQILQLLRDLVAETGTAVLFITHDLGVVAEMADRVNVMYAGQIVEKAEVDDLFRTPGMPYTWGLLDSVPRIDLPRGGRLRPIEGRPPELSAVPTGCRFAARCAFARDICRAENPDLMVLEPQGREPQLSRCWGMRPAAAGGWLDQSSRFEEPAHV